MNKRDFHHHDNDRRSYRPGRFRRSSDTLLERSAPTVAPLIAAAELQLARVADTLARPEVRRTAQLTAGFFAAQVVSAALLEMPALRQSPQQPVGLIAWLCVVITVVSAVRYRTVRDGHDLARQHAREEQTINESHRMCTFDLTLLRVLDGRAASRVRRAEERLLPGVSLAVMLALPLLIALLLGAGPAVNAAGLFFSSAMWLYQALTHTEIERAEAQAAVTRTACALKADELQHGIHNELFRKVQTDELLDQISRELDEVERQLGPENGYGT